MSGRAGLRLVHRAERGGRRSRLGFGYRAVALLSADFVAGQYASGHGRDVAVQRET